MTHIFQTEANELCHADIAVVGGGTAGTIAAIAAAGEGCTVVLIEGMGALGGTSTLGLVMPNMLTAVKGEPDNSYIAGIIRKKADERGFSDYPVYDSLPLAGLLEELAMEKNVKIHLYTRLVGVDKEGKHIRGIFVSDKEGIHYISASVYIDATGDGDLSVMAGASYTQGNPATGKNQPISLRYVVGGVDTEAFCQTYSDSVYRNGRQFCTSCKVQDGSRSIERALRCGLMAGDLVPEDLAYWQIFAIPNRPGAIACNCPEFFDRVDGTKALDLTNAQLMGKQAIERHLRFYKKYLRGFENAFLTGIAPMVGIRESREIVCDHILTLEEAKAYRKFSDAVAQTDYPIDVHGFGKEYSNKKVGSGDTEKPYFEVPFRSLVVRDIDNLFVCGRCIGTDFFVQASVRIMPTCRATGEAAGIGAALCIRNSITSHAVDGKEVRMIMEKRGAIFA